MKKNKTNVSLKQPVLLACFGHPTDGDGSSLTSLELSTTQIKSGAEELFDFHSLHGYGQP